MIDAKALEAVARAVADEEGYRYSERRRKWDRIAQACITAYLAAERERGFVMAPVEATPRMIAAAHGYRPYREDDGYDEQYDANTEMTWKSMIAAAKEGE